MGTLSAIELIKILKIVKGMNDKKKNKKRKHKRRRIKTNLLNNNNKSTHPLMGTSTYFQNPNLNTDIQREQLNNYIQEKNKLKAIENNENNEYKTLHDKYNNLENEFNDLITTANNFLIEYKTNKNDEDNKSDDNNINNSMYELNYNSDDEKKSIESIKPFNFNNFLIEDNIDVPTNDFNLNSRNQANVQTIESTIKSNIPSGGYSLEHKPKESKKILKTASKYMNRIFNKTQTKEEEKKEEEKKEEEKKKKKKKRKKKNHHYLKL